MLKRLKYHLVYTLVSCIGLTAIIIFHFLLQGSSRTVLQHEDRDMASRICMELEYTYFNNVSNSLYSLSNLNQLKDALSGLDRPLLKDLLMVLKNSYPGSVVYIMNSEGTVVEGTPYNDDGDTFRGNRYSFRPYFYNTRHGSSVIYPATGITSGIRGLYFSRGIFREGEFLGTLVVKLGVEEMETYLKARGNMTLAVMSPEGIIFASNDSSLLYSYPFPLSAFTLEQIDNNRQFADNSLTVLGEISEDGGFRRDGVSCYFGTVDFQRTEWKLLYMKPLDDYVMRPEDRVLMKIVILSLIPLLITLLFLIRIILKKQETEESLKLYNFMVEQSPISIVVTDLEGRIEYTNPYFREHTGYSCKALLGENPRVLKSGVHDQDFYKEMWDSLTGGKSWNGEICNKKQDGQLYWENARIYPLKDSRGKPYKLIAVKTDITAQKEMIDRLEYYASVDEMTSVMNRRTGMLVLEKEMNLSRRGNHTFSLCYMDVNDLKYVNDTLGHSEGDKLIQAGIKIVKDAVRSSDSVCRVGGDEFIIVLSDSDLEMSGKVVERIRRDIELYNRNSREDFILSISLGIVQFDPEKHLSAEELVQAADEIMYEEKQRYKKFRDDLKIS